ncbi:MAG: spore germination protein [Oscillospiraceae bacterium]|jgi:spore germination protein KA|nr:spore germination protein [Oscillospiraceae bacterium]
MQTEEKLSKELADNLETMKRRFHSENNNDIVFRTFETKSGQPCFIVFIDGMASGQTVNDFILRPFLVWEKEKVAPENVIQANSFKTSSSIEEAIKSVLSGDTAIFLDGSDVCYLCETKGFEHRSISTPTTENTIKGAQEAFTESLRTNTTQMHRILRTEELCSEFIPVGGINQDTCSIMYLDNVVNKKILDEVRRRLCSIKGDNIMGSGMVEQMIEDNTFSLFPSLLSTERPERAASYLASGRIIILVDGSPFAIVLPVTLALLMDSPEGGNQRWQSGTFSRMIRLFAFFCTTMLSGTYLALILFHREMIPTALLGAIMSARANIPFPSLFEVLVMELFFELVREASLRIPGMLGSAIGIVGGLILGQASVEANLVSPVTLIIVALSGVGNAALPDYDLAFGIRVIKIFVIIMGASLGFLGLAIAVSTVITVLANQNSFGVPMLSMEGLKWSANTPLPIQIPLWKQEYRPRELHPQKPVQAPRISRPWARKQKEEGPPDA